MLGAIKEDEFLWRDVYYERQKKQLAIEDRPINRNTKTVFGDGRAPYPEISTNRYDDIDLACATVLSDARAPREQGSTGIQGWLKIAKHHAAEEGRCVVYSPDADNIYHSEIVLPDADAGNWEDAKLHLMAFLNRSLWQDIEGAVGAST